MARDEWGAIFAVRIVATASCSSPTVKTAPSRDIPDARPIAREIGDVLLSFSAYDYAVVGGLNGERVRVITSERYAVVARAQAQVIGGKATRIVAADILLKCILIEQRTH